MSAYFFFDILEVTDSATFQEYARRIGPTVKQFGGRYLIRGGKVERVEGDWRPVRPVVIEFPSFDRAKQWYESADYQELIALRSGAAKVNGVLIEGVAPLFTSPGRLALRRRRASKVISGQPQCLFGCLV